MPTTVQDASSTQLLDTIESALTNGGFKTNVNASTSGYVVMDIDDGPALDDGQDSLHFSLPSDDQLKIRVGLNWDDSQSAFVHPDDEIYDTCENPTFPGEIWSDTTTLGTATGDITHGSGWVAWHGRDGTQVRIGATPVDRGTNDYQSFDETLDCECNAPDDPVAECSSEDDTFTYDTYGYNEVTYTAVLILGPGFSNTKGTLTGSRSGDIRTTPGSARLGSDQYGRDSQWELEDHDNNLAGTHDRWVESDETPINLSTRGTFTANGTFTSPQPGTDDVVFKD